MKLNFQRKVGFYCSVARLEKSRGEYNILNMRFIYIFICHIEILDNFLLVTEGNPANTTQPENAINKNDINKDSFEEKNLNDSLKELSNSYSNKNNEQSTYKQI